VLLQNLGDGRRQRGLAMIDVPDRAHVAVRLGAFKFLFRHFRSSPLLLLVGLLFPMSSPYFPSINLSKVRKQFQNLVSIQRELDRFALDRINLMLRPDEAPNATLDHRFRITY
jgi:hypothetical protein